ncbi:tRNA preQ1(34) S-adenosylmethionine ribosyltransferase-isomerase QueA [Candidatus Peregrinibacteria bacterium CG_4_10_14_0_2_um_filter_43_11]|nr:MAG: tRNA preQ1(34) S-adenosylmethionine ribosyltransferase-isomerase QueA [Candidatus Peregrinibacteria bacterium CG_4_10_14_0_2_um_filter_43_11]
MNLSDFDYELSPSFIAQHPLEERDQSKLMVLDRVDQSIHHHPFFELPDLLDPKSVLVFNESRVIPARLKFKMGEGNAEILLIKPVANDTSRKTWECMVRPGKKFNPKTEYQMDPGCIFHVKEITEEGLRIIRFECDDFNAYLHDHGEAPTPPYIKEHLSDSERYQTVYSKTEGSVAAPTAGLHFTNRIFSDLKAKGIQTEFVTLHVGLGTFQPVKIDNITEHKMHSEWFSLSAETAERLNTAKSEGRPIVAVGTTTVRVLESCAEGEQALSRLQAQSGETDIFIYPGYRFKFVDQLITNFHIPKSSLLMLVSAFADHHNGHSVIDTESHSITGRDFILRAYELAKKHDYRFFSFGDAMMIR